MFLLDDGFQHRRVARDLDLVLIDATRPFGFDHVLPRGLLREPPRNLRRADAVIVTRADQITTDALRDLDRRIERYAGRPPIAHTVHAWANADAFTGRTVLAACGIGNPEAFRATLAKHAGSIADFQAFDDHHAYTAEGLRALFDRAVAAGADAVVTTEKDYVKWRPLLDASDASPPLPILRPRVSIAFLDGQAALDGRIRETLTAAS